MTSSSEPQLRILFVVNVLAVGGAEVFLLRKMQKLRERGHYAGLVYCEKRGQTIDIYLQEYLENQDLYRISYDFSSFPALLKKLEINVVHAVQGHPYFLKLAKKLNSKMICVSSLTPKFWEADRKFNHDVYTDAIVLMSNDFLEIARKEIRNPPKMIVAIENGIDLEEFAVAREIRRQTSISLGLPENQKMILHVARIHSVKNIEDSLALAKRVCEERSDCIFLLAGRQNAEPNDNYFQELKARREEFSLNDRYLFLGERNDIRELLAIAECVICTTKSHEGSPNALLEAMSMEKPVVALRCAGISDVVKNGVTGFIADDVSEMARKLIELLDDPCQSERMGKAARDYCVRRFDLNQSVSKYESLYRQLRHGSQKDLRKTCRTKWNFLRERLFSLKRNL